MKWVTLVTAPDQLAAEMWSELLNRRGVPTLVRPGDTASFLGVSAYPCRILVDDEYLEEALGNSQGRPRRRVGRFRRFLT